MTSICYVTVIEITPAPIDYTKITFNVPKHNFKPQANHVHVCNL